MPVTTANRHPSLSVMRTFPVCAVAVLFIGLTFASSPSPVMRGIGGLFLAGLAVDTLWLVGRGLMARRG